MDGGLLHLHNLLRWVILILLLVSLVQAFTKNKGLAKTSLFLMISAHTMLLIGLYQWLAGRYGLITSDMPEGVSMMKDKFYRFFQLEHPLTMIIAVVLITLAKGKAKVQDYSKAFRFLLIALILILIRVPWPFFKEVGRPWFPGME
jgi:hypothetical protein